MASVAEHETLHHAFSAFTSVSRELEASYQALARHVGELQDRLARADRALEARLAEERRLARRFEGLLAALPAGVVVLDGSGRIQVANPAAERLLGAPLRGEEWRKVVARAFAPQPDDGHDITLASGRRVNLSTCSLGDEPGQILLIGDVTETRRLQEEAARLERLTSLGRTVAGIAHQIRTPLAAALLHCAGLPPGPARSGVLDRLRAMESLVEDMLGYARGGEFAIEPIRIGGLVDTVLGRCASLPTLGRTEREPGEADGTVVQGNPDALASILESLLENAWSAPGTTRVRLAAEARGGTVCLCCDDDGPGVPPALHERIFDPFFTTRAEGTGLGLPMVRSVVESHGGRAGIERSPLGGARFVIELPAVTASSRGPAGPE